MIRSIFGLAAVLAVLAPAAAHADFHIVSPYEIDLGEIEIEHNGSAVFDRRPEQRGAQSYTTELGTGLTPWWHSEIELGFDRDPGANQPTLLDSIVWENMFQLTEPGEHFIDAGFYFEYGQSLTRGVHAGPNQITFGPVFAKEFGRFVNTVNLFFSKELGPNQDTNGVDFSYAWQTKYNIWAPFSPAIEIYGDTGIIGQTPKLSQQQLLVGPVGIGVLKLNELGIGHAGNLKYEIGWLFGTTQATARGVLRWRLEVEIPF
jgi:hypothetical protein